MLKLFQSIFADETSRTRYPESLIAEATERAVDGTDPSLRGLLRYRKKLRKPIIRAIDYVVELVDNLDAPIDASRKDFSSDPRLRAYFVSADQLEQVCRERLKQAGFMLKTEPMGRKVCCLLIMQLEERTIFGADLVGETVVRDVPQVTASFSEHRLLDPTEDLTGTRRLLKRRAFDHLLSLALARISRLHAQGAGLQKYSLDFRLQKTFKNSSDNVSLSSNRISCVFEDENGFIWIGTADAGLNRINPENDVIKNDFLKKDHTNVTAINQDADGILWVGTVLEGIILLDPDKGEQNIYLHDNNNKKHNK